MTGVIFSGATGSGSTSITSTTSGTTGTIGTGSIIATGGSSTSDVGDRNQPNAATPRVATMTASAIGCFIIDFLSSDIFAPNLAYT